MCTLQKHELQNPFKATTCCIHQYFPSTGHLAKLSNIVYSQSESPSHFPKKESIEDLVKEWVVLGIYSGEKIQKDGYFGAAYFHLETKHLVISHRGTELSNLGTLKADSDMVLNRDTKQVWSAYLFTRAIITEFNKFSSSITITGHSLGGWLAQITAFLLEYPDFVKADLADPSTFITNSVMLSEHISYKSEGSWKSDECYHVHTVAFDTPGVKGTLEGYLEQKYPRYEERAKREYMLEILDITCYLSSPNPINSFGLHIGTIYAIDLFSDSTSRKPLKLVWDLLSKALPFKKTLLSLPTHSSSKFVEFWNKFNGSGIYSVGGWPSGFKEAERALSDSDPTKYFHSYSLTEYKKSDIYPISILDKDEKEFLENISYINLCRENEPAIPSWSEIIQNTIFSDYFVSFEICERNRLRILDGSSIDLFLFKMKWLIKSKEEFQKKVSLVISNYPKVFEVIYETIGKQCLLGLPKFNCSSKSIIDKIKNFLLNNDIEFVLTCHVNRHTKSLSAALLYSSLKNNSDTKHFTDDRTGLFLDTNFLQILNIQVPLDKVLFSCSKLKLIVLKCETMNSELVRQLMDVIQKIQRIKLLILVPDSTAQLSFSDEELKIEYSMLEDTEKVLLMNTRINFQGKSLFLKNLITDSYFSFDSFLLRSLLMPTSKIVIGEPIQNYFKEIYIERKFKQMILGDNPQPKRKTEIFLIYDANLQDVTKYFQLEFLTQVQVLDHKFTQTHSVELGDALYFIMKEKVSLEIIVSKFRDQNFGGHLFRYEEGDHARLVYESSFGLSGLPSISLKVDSRNLIPESHIFNLKQNLKVIVDEPGMGKSTILKHFAQKFQTEKISNWSFYIDLASWKRKLQEVKYVAWTIDQISEYFTEGTYYHNLRFNILRHSLEEGRVSFFFDSFDEISQELQNVVVSLVISIQCNTNANIWIASRPLMREFLESRFGTFALALSPLSETERVEFLTEFWVNHKSFNSLNLYPEGVDDAIIFASTCANSLLCQLRYSLNVVGADDFIGIPLQLFMIGNLTISQFLSHLETVNNNTNPVQYIFKLEFNSVFDLYQLFVTEKYRIGLEEKCKLSIGDWQWHFQCFVNSVANVHRLVSFSLYFPEETNIFSISEGKILNDDENMLELYRIGMVYKETQSYKFIHPTLAEYFVADFIVTKLIQLEEFKDSNQYSRLLNFLERNYFYNFFDKIRYFMDHFIAYNPISNVIFKKCLNWDKQKKEIFEILKNESDIRDMLGRTVLHYAMVYGDHQREGNLWIIIQNQHLILAQDNFGTTFASYIPLAEKFRFFRIDDEAHTLEYLLKYCPFKDTVCAEENISKLEWILWFTGTRLDSLVEQMRNELKFGKYCDLKPAIEWYWDILREWIDLSKLELNFRTMIANPPTISIDLKILAIRGCDTLSDSISQVLCSYTCENVMEALKIAITLASKKHVNYAMQLFGRLENIKTLSMREKKLIQYHFILFIFQNGLKHYKVCVQYFSADFEYLLWKRGNKEEIFELMMKSNMISLLRAMSSFHSGTFVTELLKYPTSIDVKKKMMESVCNCCDTMNVFFNADYNDICDYWNFFDASSQEKLLKSNFTSFTFFVIETLRINKVELDNLNHKFRIKESKFLFLVYNSVGSDLKKTIEKAIGGMTMIEKIGQMLIQPVAQNLLVD